MTAAAVKFLHNPAIEQLINRAVKENRFSGYLKKLGDKWYVKEIDSYIFFPLQLSPWEFPPVETAENEAIFFSLLNTEKPHALVAELFSHNYIPAYRKALQHFKNQMDTEGLVTKISPFGIYLDLFDGAIKAKLPVKKGSEQSLKEGDKIALKIIHLTNTRIVVEELVNGGG